MADDREVLQDAGKITAEIAKAKAETEFEKYRVVQDRLFMSDFDKYMLELEENAKKQYHDFKLNRRRGICCRDIIIRLHICIHWRKIKFIFNEIDKTEFAEEYKK